MISSENFGATGEVCDNPATWESSTPEKPPQHFSVHPEYRDAKKSLACEPCGEVVRANRGLVCQACGVFICDDCYFEGRHNCEEESNGDEG